MSKEAAEKMTNKEMSSYKNYTRMSNKSYPRKDDKMNNQEIYSATALNSTTTTQEDNQNEDVCCVLCGHSNRMGNCFVMRKKSVDERLLTGKNKGLCFNCLQPMTTSDCKRPGCAVEGCKGKHYTILHRRPCTINIQRM